MHYLFGGVAVVEWLRSRPLDCEVRGSNPSGGEGVSPVQGEAN